MHPELLLAHPGVVAISFDCCAFGSAKKGSMTVLFHGLDDKPDGHARRCGRQPTCRFSGQRHWSLHQWKHKHGPSWDTLPSDLASRIVQMSDAPAMIYNRLDVKSTLSSPLPHQRDALRASVLSGEGRRGAVFSGSPGLLFSFTSQDAGDTHEKEHSPPK